MGLNIIRLPIWRRETLRCRSLRPTPITLSHEERTPKSASIHLPGLLIHDIGLVVHYRARLAFIINAEDLSANLELATGGGGRQGLVEFHETLAIKDAAGVEFGDTRDGSLGLCGIEVDYFLFRSFESCMLLEGTVMWGGVEHTEDDGVCWEDGEVRMKFLFLN